MNQSRRLFIGNVHYEADENEVSSALGNLGILVFSVRIVKDRETGNSRGFGFVDLDRSEKSSVDEVIALINESEVYIRDRMIRADNAKQGDRPDYSSKKRSNGRGKKRSEFHGQKSEFAHRGDFSEDW